MHNELWAQTWQVVILGMFATFVFIGLLVACLKMTGGCCEKENTEEKKE